VRTSPESGHAYHRLDMEEGDQASQCKSCSPSDGTKACLLTPWSGMKWKSEQNMMGRKEGMEHDTRARRGGAADL